MGFVGMLADPVAAHAPDSWLGAIVLGSHRSGTSAVTGIIDALGLPACREDDRYEIREWSGHGLFESKSLSLFDESLLTRIGGAWWAPPLPPAGWARSPEFRELQVEGAYKFAAAHPAGRWVWKDPRACVLMPFWDAILGPDCPRIIVLRNPLECAASLAKRNVMPVEIGLAVTERNLRTALRDSARRPVWITTYLDLLGDARGWCRQAESYLRSNGLSLSDPLPVDRASEFVTDSLRHHRDDERSLRTAAPRGLQRLWDWALEHRGVHPSFSAKGLPRESPETGPVIERAVMGFTPLEDGRIREARKPAGD